MYNNDNIPLSYYFNKYKNLNSLEYNYNNVSVWFYKYDRAPLLTDILRSLKYFNSKNHF